MSGSGVPSVFGSRYLVQSVRNTCLVDKYGVLFRFGIRDYRADDRRSCILLGHFSNSGWYVLKRYGTTAKREEPRAALVRETSE